MSARDRAFKVWQEIDQKRDPVEWIELALKEQDKITRHAIAEAIIEHGENGHFDYQEKSFSFLFVNTAHSIAMNTLAV